MSTGKNKAMSMLQAAMKAKETTLAGGGLDTLYAYKMDDNKEYYIRLMPSVFDSGAIFLKRRYIFIRDNDKSQMILCPSTFGGDSVIEPILQEAKKVKSEAIQKKLYDINRFPFKGLYVKEDFITQILLLECTMDKFGRIETEKVMDDTPKKFVVGQVLARDINDEFMSNVRDFVEPCGIANIKSGNTIKIVKAVAPGTKTSYKVGVMAKPTDMPDKFDEGKADLGIYKELQEQLLSNEEIIETVEGFLYGASKTSGSAKPSVLPTAPVMPPSKASTKPESKAGAQDVDDDLPF